MSSRDKKPKAKGSDSKAGDGSDSGADSSPDQTALLLQKLVKEIKEMKISQETTNSSLEAIKISQEELQAELREENQEHCLK